ncbi:MAG: tripartite tricarboxylate transporter substrate-binding protein [Burkholderiaceae bacterium]|nr:tripartite tricarboxylate transporter substrate-binding protein [Burkholderiaceae bacterium]
MTRLCSAAGMLLLGSLAVSGAISAHAQSWPQKPVKLIVPSGPGSAPDQIARLMGEKLSRALGQPVIVENKVGAGGLIAVNQLRQAPPDGYTLSVMQAAVATTTPLLYKEANYDVVRDLEAVSIIGISPMMFVSNPNFPAKTLAEAINAAKAAPGAIALASSSRGSIPNLAGELLGRRAGVQFQNIPYQSSGQAVQAVVGDQVPLFVDGVGAVIQLVRAGKLRALAVASETVLPGLEGIPLAKDTVPGLNLYGWYALIAPKGTPKDVIARLNKEVNQIVKDPEIVDIFRKQGSYPRGSTPEGAQQFIRNEMTLFGDVIKASGLKPE